MPEPYDGEGRKRERETERWIHISKVCVVCYHRFQLDNESKSQISTQNIQDTKTKDSPNWEWHGPNSSEPIQRILHPLSTFQKISCSRCKHKLVHRWGQTYFLDAVCIQLKTDQFVFNSNIGVTLYPALLGRNHGLALMRSGTQRCSDMGQDGSRYSVRFNWFYACFFDFIFVAWAPVLPWSLFAQRYLLDA